MIFVARTDFIGGKFDIPDADGLAGSKANVQETIDDFETKYIHKLLGVTLGDLVIAYKQAGLTPTNAGYDYIINPFSLDNSGACFEDILESMGIKKFLMACIYFEYVNNGLVNAQAGVVASLSETSEAQSSASTLRYAENKFNDLINTVEAIQWYCNQNKTAMFPTYNGTRIPMKFSGVAGGIL